MPFESSQVIGVVEIDGSPTHKELFLGPNRWPSRINRPAPEGATELVHANLVQINNDLRVELARIVARLAMKRSR